MKKFILKYKKNCILFILLFLLIIILLFFISKHHNHSINKQSNTTKNIVISDYKLLTDEKIFDNLIYNQFTLTKGVKYGYYVQLYVLNNMDYNVDKDINIKLYNDKKFIYSFKYNISNLEPKKKINIVHFTDIDLSKVNNYEVE